MQSTSMGVWSPSKDRNLHQQLHADPINIYDRLTHTIALKFTEDFAIHLEGEWMSDTRNPDIGMVLAFLSRDDSFKSENLCVQDWLSLCVSLKSVGLLGVSCCRLLGCSPAPVRRILANWNFQHRADLRRRVESLSGFADVARREHLHFVLIKGMALSSILYADPFVRQSGDVDILVASDDIPKADYVARKTGWYQPGEARLVRNLQDGRSLYSESLKTLQIAYPIRSNSFLPHVTNYYFPYDNGVCESLEVHDRFHALDSRTVEALIRNPRPVEISGIQFFTVSDEAAFVLSALSLYEDSLTIRASCSNHSSLGLKTAFDLYSFVCRSEESLSFDLGSAISLASDLGVLGKIDSSLCQVADIFNTAKRFIYPRYSSCNSVWAGSYLNRLMNPETRVSNVFDLIKRAFADDALSRGSHLALGVESGIWINLQAADSSLPSPFDVCADYRTRSLERISLRIPAYLSELVDDLTFQVVVINSSDDIPSLGKRVNVFVDEGSWVGFSEDMTFNRVDGHASHVKRGDPKCVNAFSKGDCIEVNLSIDIDFTENSHGLPLVFVSVWKRIYGELFRIVAGRDPIDVMSGVLDRIYGG